MKTSLSSGVRILAVSIVLAGGGLCPTWIGGAKVDAVVPGVATADPQDAEFFRKAQIRSLALIRLCELAKARASTAEIRAMADEVLRGDNAVQNDLSKLASRQGIPLPTEIDGAARDLIQDLRETSGVTFDENFLVAARQWQTESVQIFTAHAERTQDQGVINYLRGSIPILKAELAKLSGQLAPPTAS